MSSIRLVLSLIVVAAAASSIVPEAHAGDTVAGEMVAWTGMVAPGAGGETIDTILHAYPQVDAEGRVVFTGRLSNDRHFLWHDDGVIWIEPGISGGSLGESSGVAIVDGQEWLTYDTHAFTNGCIRWDTDGYGELCLGAQMPGLPTESIGGIDTPRMAADGTIYFYAGCVAVCSGLFRMSSGVTEPILVGSVPTTPGMEAPNPDDGMCLGVTHVGRELDISEGGSYGTVMVNLLDGNAPRQTMLTFETGGAGGCASFAPVFWIPFGHSTAVGGLSINDTGQYVFAGIYGGSDAQGLITGQHGGDPVVQLEPGDELDCLTLDGPAGAAINNNGRILHTWIYGSCVAAMFVGSIEDVAGTSKLVLRTGQNIDTPQGTLENVTLRYSSSPCGPNIQEYDFGDDGNVYVGVSYEDGGTQHAIVRLPPVTCKWDLDGDNAVAVNDLVTIILDWGTCYDVEDLVNLILAWGPCP